MSCTCYCPEGNTIQVDSCNLCPVGCSCDCNNTKAENVIIGITLTAFIILIVLNIVLLAFMIWFSVATIKRCKGKPGWLNPTIITLLILWLLLSWVPGFGLVCFIVLLVILINFYIKCAPNKK